MMRMHRRRFLQGLGATPVAFAAPSVHAQRRAISDLPDPGTFQLGDLVWPKKKGSFIPRSATPAAPPAEQAAWEMERDRMLKQDPAESGLTPEVAEKLRNMRYGDFARAYFSAPNPGEAPAPAPTGTRSSSAGTGEWLTVGHVGFIDLDARRVPYVVEATPRGPLTLSGGVIRAPYTEWLKSYGPIQVWHGRPKGVDPSARRGVLDVALAQLGKPYSFFNFNLLDDSSFYCSKLVWFSVWRSLRLAFDDDPEPKRGSRFPPWFSPKQLINAGRIELLHKPADY